MFIMLDGIDGSGKSTIVQTWREYLTFQGNAVFDLKNYWKTENKYPEFNELQSYDFVFSAEPASVGIGKVIREELGRTGTDYPERAVAEAFSLDRLILYKKIIIPALRDGKGVIQDRGVSTSLAYQPAQSPELTLETVASLVGNQLAIAHRPDHLVLADIKPETAMARLSGRAGKQDDSIFEKLDLLKKIDANYKSTAFREIFISRGTKIHYLSTEAKIDIMKERAVALLKELLAAI